LKTTCKALKAGTDQGRHGVAGEIPPPERKRAARSSLRREEGTATSPASRGYQAKRSEGRRHTMNNEESRPESDSTPGSEQGLKSARWSPRRRALLWGALGFLVLVAAGVILFLAITRRSPPEWVSDPELRDELDREYEVIGTPDNLTIGIDAEVPRALTDDCESKGYRVRLPRGWKPDGSVFGVLHPEGGFGRGTGPVSVQQVGALWFVFDFSGNGEKEGRTFEESLPGIQRRLAPFTWMRNLAFELEFGPVEQGKVGGLTCSRNRIRHKGLGMRGFAYVIWDGKTKISAFFLIKADSPDAEKAERVAEAAVLSWRKAAPRPRPWR
jgi:hypothetical protein